MATCSRSLEGSEDGEQEHGRRHLGSVEYGALAIPSCAWDCVGDCTQQHESRDETKSTTSGMGFEF